MSQNAEPRAIPVNRRAEERRWARDRKAFNTSMVRQDQLYAKMTRRQRRQVQVDAGLMDPKNGQACGPWFSQRGKRLLSGRYVGGRSMTLMGLKILAAEMAKRMAKAYASAR